MEKWKVLQPGQQLKSSSNEHKLDTGKTKLKDVNSKIEEDESRGVLLKGYIQSNCKLCIDSE